MALAYEGTKNEKLEGSILMLIVQRRSDKDFTTTGITVCSSFPNNIFSVCDASAYSFLSPFSEQLISSFIYDWYLVEI